MITIIRGTTPTIKYKFKSIDVSEITVAYLTIKRGNEVILTRDIATAHIESNATETNDSATLGGYISWTLTQEETLGVYDGTSARIMCNWKIESGTRGATKEETLLFADNHVIEVI